MKAKISKFLRKTRLLGVADKLRFLLAKYKNYKKNVVFQAKYPKFKFPTDYLMYESFMMNYESYYKSGVEAAKEFIDILKQYKAVDAVKILDWGCGPARVVRHIPAIIPENCEVFGTDYNKNSIQWDKENIKNVEFNLNGIRADLPYESDFFDFIYGISIFTHLSEQLHFDWKNELTRVLKKNGILLLTLQGDLFKSILTDSEIKIFEEGNLVVRGNVKEGHRTYSAFQPDIFVKQLFSDYDILEHIPSYINNGSLEQDVWVLRKN